MQTWQQINQKRIPFIKMGENLFGGMLKEIRRSLLSEIREVERPQQIPAVLEYFRFDAPMKEGYERFYARTAPYFAKDFLNRYKGGKGPVRFKDLDDDLMFQVIEWVRVNTGKKITAVIQHHYDDIVKVALRAVETGLGQGWGMDQTAKMIAQQQGEIDLWKALRIARTETVAASNYGVELGAEQLPGNKVKVWISSFTTTSRGARASDNVNHMAMDGQQVGMNDYFTEPMTGDQLLYPGDPNAPTDQIINCRCAHEVIITDEIF